MDSSPTSVPQRPAAGLPSPALQRLLAAECAAAAAVLPAELEAEDLRQAVLLRWLERPRNEGHRDPETDAGWIRLAVRAETRRAGLRAAGELPVAAPPAPEEPVLAFDGLRALGAAISRLPGRCPAVVRMLLRRDGLTYAELARELGMSQGAVGPLRSRCLACLRRLLPAEVP